MGCVQQLDQLSSVIGRRRRRLGRLERVALDQRAVQRGERLDLVIPPTSRLQRTRPPAGAKR
jgi:hypothetical protein